MSKRVSQTNTLFNYFSSPKGKLTPKKTGETSNTPSKTVNTPLENKENIKKEVRDEESDEEIRCKKKRSRVALIDSESESENDTPVKRKSSAPHSRPSKKQKIASDESQSEDSDSEKSLNESKSEISSSSQQSLINSFGFKKKEENGEVRKSVDVKKPEKKKEKIVENNTDSSWPHEKLEFLKPEKIRDAEKRKPSHPEYDPRTLYVPPDFLNQVTPGMRQWWMLKSQHMDCILFFKMGKFYELYHMDAVIGVQVLGISYMKGETAHSGFPEKAYGKMATTLVDRGYKVARVEQTETPEMMTERCKQQKKTTKFDKVVTRELCQISSRASCVYGPQMPEAKSNMGCYLYGIAAKVSSDGTSRFGVTFVETSIGKFYMSEFDDDKFCSKLLTIFSEYPPGLILTEKTSNYGYFKSILSSIMKDVMQETLAPKTQFYAASKTLETLYSHAYFKDKNGKFVWPHAFNDVAEECNPKQEYELALKSLGGVHWFLKNSQLDIQVFSMNQFELYNPIVLKDAGQNEAIYKRDHMVVDSATIKHLHLLGGAGSLERKLDFCKTAFGKRMLPLWICRPSCNINEIKCRQGAISEIFGNAQIFKATQDILSKLPDLERQVAKIHVYGNKVYSTNHPDSRAILYEGKFYSKTKIMDFIKTLRGFELSQQIVSIYEDCESSLLRNLTQYEPKGIFPDLTDTLKFFKGAFNHEQAEKDGSIIPKSGVDSDYDRVQLDIEEINKELQKYLKEQSKYFGCEVTYFGTDKKRYQLVIPENKARKADDSYYLEGQKKGAKPVKRFTTDTTKELLQKMMKAEAERNKIIRDLNRRIFEKFSQKSEEWQQVIHCLTVLDLLCSLAQYARKYSGDICKPDVQEFSKNPFISIANGKLPNAPYIDNFVPNDTSLGGQDAAPLLILTGPNMGGKSTLMRQVSIICIMAQMGSFVPASKCSLSLIDRIFTRLGACDDIIRGQSTFFVELSEASMILKHATKQSLLIVDELGRGTSTHDGNAIATAYVRKLVEMKCRTIFSTHYHSLVDHFVDDKNVHLGHMACMVENDDDPSEESVILLYKLAEGRCPKSYGFNAAKLAGVKAEVVARARTIAKEIEDEDLYRRTFTTIFSRKSDPEYVKQLLKNLKI
ncbi:probable DNA mismatch repair protein Msh6 [Sitophilus oryzae]|uniref:DNA mismatch repair protein n=1 Tax=Sitophilus oryzae TaxID=7048 RepID=A0A6J2XMI5_SITOR|nr:probable DNA mismatch repair protein Msh6 [Sitophilus oryzae]